MIVDDGSRCVSAQYTTNRSACKLARRACKNEQLYYDFVTFPTMKRLLNTIKIYRSNLFYGVNSIKGRSFVKYSEVNDKN